MRIALFGPLPSESKNGGVAVFQRYLANKLIQLGHEVIVVTSLDGMNDSACLAPKISVVNSAHELKQFKPDFTFGSTWYSLLIPRNITGTKVHLLHGFTNGNAYSFVKFLAMMVIDRIIKRRTDLFLANSKFTKFINEEMFGLKVQGVFQIGLPDSQLEKMRNSKTNLSRRDFVYIGRLVSAKGVDKIIRCFSNYENEWPESHLKIVGYGPEENKLKKMAGNHRISFLGKKSHESVLDEYNLSKVFISLNAAEPYGITYLEALLSNMYIIAPNTGGHVELLQQFPDRVSLVDISSEEELFRAMRKGIESDVEDIFTKYDCSHFSYDYTVKQLVSGDRDGIICNNASV